MFKKLFNILQIPEKKYIVSDKKREQEAIPLILDLLRKGECGGLISDCGTPLFEDPGYRVLDAIRQVNQKKPIAKIVSLPGANSIITAMTLAPFEIKQFFFAGFICRDNKQRDNEILALLCRRETVIFMESPLKRHGNSDIMQDVRGV